MNEYQQSVNEFRTIVKTALAAKAAVASFPTDDIGLTMDTLFLKTILGGLSINQLLEPRPVGGLPALSSPDPCSIGVVVRSIAETYLTQFLFSKSRSEPQLGELRLLWWRWQAGWERKRAYENLGKPFPEASVLDQLRNQIANHSCYSRIPDKMRNGFEKRDHPKHAVFEKLRDIAANAGIHPTRFEVFYQMTSATAHSEPLLVEALCSHNPYADRIQAHLSLRIKEATAFVAFSIELHASEFKDVTHALSKEFQDALIRWREIFKRPF